MSAKDEGVGFAPAVGVPAAVPVVRDETSARPTARRLTIAVAILVAVLIPFAGQSFIVFQLTLVMIYALAILGLNLLTGFNGQFSLGHSAFYGIGAYTTAILMDRWDIPYYATLPAAGMVCFIVGFLFGLPALRLQGVYLALATFALAVATPQMLAYKRIDFLTGGSQGLQVPKPGPLFGLPMSVDQSVFWLCLAVAVVLFAVACNLVHGRVGRALVAIRDHPIAAETMGVDAALYKTLCFGVSALYAGIAGGLSAVAVGFVSPESFGLSLSLAFLVGIVIGGLASLPGAIFGALFIEFVPNWADMLTVYLGENAKALPGAVYGLTMILMMAAAPMGIAGLMRSLTKRLSPR